MYTALDLDQMAIADKLRTMENLCDDLCRHSEQVQSPDWHHQELSAREHAMSVAEAAFEDWGTAKKRIRESLT